MSLKEQLAKDAKNVFLNPDEGAELITYQPKNDFAKDIYAQVVRKQISPASEDSGRTLKNQVEIYIANDADDGVIAVNKGGDKVSLPERIGEDPIDWAVIDILDQDDGMWHLLIEK